MRKLYLQALLLIITLCFSANQLLAQATGGGGAEGESPYSSSTVEGTPGEGFFSSYGLVIGCLIVFVGLILFISLRGRTRS